MYCWFFIVFVYWHVGHRHHSYSTWLLRMENERAQNYSKICTWRCSVHLVICVYYNIHFSMAKVFGCLKQKNIPLHSSTHTHTHTLLCAKKFLLPMDGRQKLRFSSCIFEAMKLMKMILFASMVLGSFASNRQHLCWMCFQWMWSLLSVLNGVVAHILNLWNINATKASKMTHKKNSF